MPKKIIRFILKSIAFFLFFLAITIIALIFIIQVPAVQQKIIQAATHFITDKTNTIVSIGEVGISFPKSVYLKNIYLEDKKRDTLLSAGSLSVNIDLPGLIKNRIHINNIKLHHASAYISRQKGDSLYNFDFLIKAFSGSKTTVKTDTVKSTTQFQLDEIQVTQLSFHYLDSFEQVLVNASIDSLHLKSGKTDIQNLDFKINNLMLKNANLSVSIPAEVNRKKTREKATKNPVIAADNIQLINTDFTFNHGPDSISLEVLKVNLQLKNAYADIKNNTYRAGLLSLSDCMTEFRKDKLIGHLSQDSETRKKTEMKISVNEIQLKNNHFAYTDNSKQKNPGFDPGHFVIKNIGAGIQNAGYTNGEISANVKKFTLQEQKGFEVKQLSGKLAYLNKGIILDELQLQTQSSSIAGNFSISFNAIGELKDSLKNATVAVKMKTSTIYSGDLVYFVQALKDAPYLSANTSTVIEAEIAGPVGLLQVKKLNIHAGNQTSFFTSFTITGLPDINKAVLIMPDGQLNTSKNDLNAFLPKGMIPETIDLPGMMHSEMNFNGGINNFISQVKFVCDYGQVNARLELNNKIAYTANVELLYFDAGRLLRKTDQLGEMSLSLKINGSGFKKDSIHAIVAMQADEINFNKYVYHNLEVKAIIEKQLYDFTIAIKDTSMQLTMAGQVDLNSGIESYKLNGNIAGINLYNLNFSSQDIRLAADLNVDIRRDSSRHYLSGNAAITNMSVFKSTDKYFIDTTFMLSVNQDDFASGKPINAIAALYIKGDIEPVDLPNSLLNLVNNYFYLAPAEKNKQEQDFAFRLQLNNHPVLQGILLRDLKAFKADEITGSYRSRENYLSLNTSVAELNYKGIIASNANLMLSTDSSGLKISLLTDSIVRDPVKINALSFNTFFHNQQADVSLSTGKESDDNRLVFNATIFNKNQSAYKIKLANALTLNSLVWNIPPDNEIVLAKQYLTFHHVELENNGQRISINKEAAGDDLLFNFKNFGLDNVTRILNRDTLLADGKLGGILIAKSDGSIIADLHLDNLLVKSQLIGNIYVDASSLSRNEYSIKTTLTGNDNDVEVKGNISVEKGNQTLNLIADIRKVNLKSIEPFTMGQLRESAGMLKGKLTVTGTMENPIVNGGIDFAEVATIPAFTNNKIYLKNEHIDITDEAIRFPAVIIRDKNDHTAKISGEIRKKGFTDFKFDLNLSTKNFIFLNTTQKDNEVFFGNLLADCEAKLTGDLTVPRIAADINVLKGTHFSFAVQQNQTSTDRGEGVILFTDSHKLNPILMTNISGNPTKSEIKGMDITANIKIDPEAVLTILIDPVTGDSLSVRGEATLSFALDEGGKISLTGRYELTDGSYLVTLQQFIHRKFLIQKGSTITWNGDPLDAEVNMTAIYKVNTSPADLIVNEVGTVSEEELKSYRQRLPFEVNLILKDKLLTPEISFSIELPEEYRGAMGGVVNSKLNLLKEDPSELNKQVFALLILNRFIQQDPFTSASGSGAESVARLSVGKFLSQELNNLSAQYIKGVELNVDVQSYDDGTNPSGAGTTEVEVGVKKNFFNERLSVQVGGNINVEGAAQKNNQSGDLSGNVIIEYKLTPDGRYRLKGFRQNEYEGFIDGQLTETGVGIIYSWDFGKWKEIVSPPRKDDDK